MTTQATKTIRAGGPCTCSPDRRVRWVVPACPGLRAEVSCRTGGTANWTDVRHHDVPAGVAVEVYVAELETPC